MIEVELPDGTIAEFPDGTPQDTIKSALRRRFAPAQPEGSVASAPEQPPQQPGQPQISGGVIMPPAVPASGQWETTQNAKTLGSIDRRLGGALAEIREPINAFNQAFTNMYMLGGLDEVQGAADAAMTGQSFGDARQAAKRVLDEQGEQFPVTTTVAGLTGAVTSPAAQAVMRAFPAGAGLKAQIGAGAASGAAMGGAQGFMEGEGSVTNRLTNAGVNALYGAGVGGAVPAVTNALGAGYRGVQSWISDRRAAGQIGQQLGISRKGGGLLSDVVGMDDSARMRAALAQGGPDAMLADAGPTVQGALDGVIQAPGEGARTALRRIDNRAVAAGSRLSDELDTAMTGSAVGAPSGRQFSNTATMQGDIRSATAPARKAMYDAAYAQPIDYGSVQGAALLDDITPRLPPDAVNYANKLMRLNGEKSAQIMASVADDGSVAFTNPPDVRQWDYIKQALDGLAESGDGAGALGGQTRMGAGYQGLARDIRRNLGQAVPEYDYAVNAAGDIIGQVKAIKSGEDLLKAGTSRADVETMIDGMSKAELAAVKRGLRQSIDDQIANVRAIATDPNIDAREVTKSYAMLTSRASQDKMKLLLGKDWQPIRKALDETASALGLRARVSTNSRTFGRQQFGQMIEDAMAPGRIASGDALGPLATPRTIWQNMTGSTPSGIQRSSARVKNELAEVLTRPGAVNLLQGIEAIRAANLPNPLAGQGLTNALNVLGLSSLPASVPEVRNLLR